ncbi:uncharacterized protein LOC131430855 [Malaya genurostris]|uniref:uncharacterized protein LOC131430855 n=1 Tax=Malaya genurostris TaxID=325434 RepID=UPI0026F3A970|nr:uncharacterized protein LOC131430855 [Malaya genurostris]
MKISTRFLPTTLLAALLFLIPLATVECVPLADIRVSDDTLVQPNKRELIQLFQEDANRFSSSLSDDLSSEELTRNVLRDLSQSTTMSPEHIQLVRRIVQKYKQLTNPTNY